ncbi:hypothetical protein BO94DRAFT_532427 [Aspergillus sclerotioniger CBS 115572]|uniref:Nascent polypeptide-associated complex subunit alpha-like UBA domain-containing protein n=1 Tax=Aspergillus sclerotioniger CBS 115572 TaxID=1450535 RepID=A0A317X4G2_9EURO|nr:hypothetical protein BO94DRAFT_532427 [Aspergillus sclerotioniger CBS 115572]PWY93489.1 hypothetical protein BO94DRAFT_532427 [Aspergillus sclerotioniger CBS 115572]
MSDSIPSAHADAEAPEQQHPPANAEDRKAAAALSALNTSQIASDATPKAPSAADQEALGKAMSRLEIAAGHGLSKKPVAEAQRKEAEVVKKKAVKVAAEDVNLLVNELDLTKIKATELLKLHDGNVVQAIRAFVTPALGA